ncbi:Serine hydrolase-like protein [Araneus ventricosus]|uniref:Serine hydrolase-like protein n=1 Tax=Araneus ventricosus TaxID=182803 RepID=A0A4Y2BE38_ARAVE|nr:Serine hydrolase-like protein [Araneus ventricosus]
MKSENFIHPLQDKSSLNRVPSYQAIEGLALKLMLVHNQYSASLRTFPHPSSTMPNWSNQREIRIPTSYGSIAAKAWGDEHNKPVLALHGWQDNAGTFDRLIPLLCQDLYIVAVDLPGQGLSSHFQEGSTYLYINILLEIKRVVDYLKWEAFSIIGHSLGGAYALLYSCTYPECIINVILLDFVKPFSYSAEELRYAMRQNMEELLKVEGKSLKQAPVYSYIEARERLIQGFQNQITLESADVLMKRASKSSKCGKGVVFSRDIRTQAKISSGFTHDGLKAFLRNMRCNLLIILGKDTPELYGLREGIDDFLNLYKETCKNFQLVEIDGNHYVHLNNPERVAPLVDNFFHQNLSSLLPSLI